MKKITNFIHNVVHWFVVSSADPKRTSLTVQSLALALIPIVIHVVQVSCGFGFVCLGVEAQDLEKVAYAISQIVFDGLTIISLTGFICGFVRKVWMTVTGQLSA